MINKSEKPLVDMDILYSVCNSLFNKKNKERKMFKLFEIILLAISMITLTIVMVFLTDTLMDKYRDSRSCGSFTMYEFNKGDVPSRCLNYFNR